MTAGVKWTTPPYGYGAGHMTGAKAQFVFFFFCFPMCSMFDQMVDGSFKAVDDFIHTSRNVGVEDWPGLN